jgi:hypothetical protein
VDFYLDRNITGKEKEGTDGKLGSSLPELLFGKNRWKAAVPVL